MYLNNLLTAYGETIGLSPLELDENNVCHLIFDQGHELIFEPSADHCFASLYSVLGQLPAIDLVTVYEAVLARNLFGLATGHASICVDKTAQELILFQALNPMYMDASAFIYTVESFVDQHYQQQHWLSGFTNTALASPKASTNSAEPDFAIKV
jgi:hypothetical protein